MKKLVIIVLMIFAFYNSEAQVKKNLFEIGRSFYYFKKSGFDWDVIYNVRLGYTRRIKSTKWKFRMDSEFFLKEYTIDRKIMLGDVFERWFLIFDALAYRTLLVNKNSEFGISLGALYRFGSENKVMKIINRGIWTDIVTPEIDVSAFGIYTSVGNNYKLNTKWTIGTEFGVHKYFLDIGTLFVYFATLKVGYIY